MNALYYNDEVSIPVAFEIIRKPLQFCDVKTRQIKRASKIIKNELLRDMLKTCVNNPLKFRYVLLFDIWFAATENFEAVLRSGKHFVAALKDNRQVALTLEDKQQGHFVKVGELTLLDRQAVRGWLKGFDQEVLLVRRVFTNKDGSTGTLNLV
ncbi:hypothetical protein SAMN05421882_10186 [Nitrosomonas communis]|uniref:Transposase IS701-like DDE domain-containing protein n=1 Tax=Nitrosomonas communis TaxID=44574 RepID=A0A1H2UUK4_9PROT|nr:hypothetical protein SAMN05421882_10186 [Nitrosomonas communis]